MTQIINGHLIVYYPATCCWVVDGSRFCYSLSELASVVGLRRDLLEEVLYIY